MARPQSHLRTFAAVVALAGAALGLALRDAREGGSGSPRSGLSWWVLTNGGLALLIWTPGASGVHARQIARSITAVVACGVFAALVGFALDTLSPFPMLMALGSPRPPTSFWLVGGGLGLLAGVVYIRVVAINHRRAA